MPGAADIRRLLDDQEIADTALEEFYAHAQAGHAGTDDDDLVLCLEGHGGLRAQEAGASSRVKTSSRGPDSFAL
jgi:hypothetical protein